MSKCHIVGNQMSRNTRSLTRAFASGLNILWINLLNEHHLEFLHVKGGYTGSSEATLAKMSFCWKSPLTTHAIIRDYLMAFWLSLEVSTRDPIISPRALARELIMVEG